MGVFNVHDAKTQLSRLLERVVQGEEIIIAKSGLHPTTPNHSAIIRTSSSPEASMTIGS
ncbi:MAG TPA: type II toxin-antitoxin system prevent-host-death family antitoxin [Thermoanaerobaculia bacterium]|nr:type II toxin-antitoxin system prevent-host-death family antitoxin [Thermoanaerobaculia bacterium]